MIAWRQHQGTMPPVTAAFIDVLQPLDVMYPHGAGAWHYVWQLVQVSRRCATAIFTWLVGGA